MTRDVRLSALHLGDCWPRAHLGETVGRCTGAVPAGLALANSRVPLVVAEGRVSPGASRVPACKADPRDAVPALLKQCLAKAPSWAGRQEDSHRQAAVKLLRRYQQNGGWQPVDRRDEEDELSAAESIEVDAMHVHSHLRQV